MKTIAVPLSIYVLAILIALTAFPPLSKPVLIEVRPTKLVLFNNSTDMAYFSVFEQKAAKSARWNPCDHPDLCASQQIKPGLVQHIPYMQIYRWTPGASVTVFWWQLEVDSTAVNGYRVVGPSESTVNTPKKPILGM
ncbi:MAG: hypothetical protein JSW54_08470 [Fidelibacterota bacterium]|nr:MAG: hypothetical protein JSW54_08470 [Candidatus Neomarinimicrobiota bacterium]